MTKDEMLWDDDLFRTWVREGCEKQGMTQEMALLAAGVSRFYLKV
jgi:hypothetical protein